jgi:hypothetical protein
MIHIFKLRRIFCETDGDCGNIARSHSPACEIAPLQ